MSRFVITGLPRSRTAWFSAYLTSGDVFCHHEAIPKNISLTGYPYVGTADCGYILCPDWVNSIGEHKLIIIHRDVNEVMASMKKIGLEDEIGYLPMLAEKLYKLDGFHIEFNEINKALPQIHKYLGIPDYNEERALLFIDMNIQLQEWRI